MRKTWLQVEGRLGFLYIAILVLLTIINDQGRIVALTMLFSLGVWQYVNALIWMLNGDHRRKRYLAAATIYLAVTWFLIYSQIGKYIQDLLAISFMVIPIALAIWYQLITLQHARDLENEGKKTTADNVDQQQ